MTEKSTTNTTTEAAVADKPGFVFFKGLSWLAFYFLAGLAIFFASAVLIFSLRNRSSEQVKMVNLVGKYYTEIHNELNKHQFRVTLETRMYPDLSPGVIIAQDVAPGEIIAPRAKLRLIVNQGKPLLNMPSLIGNTLESAQVALGRVTHGEDLYSLKTGSITRIQSEISEGIVLAQFPPAETRISVEAKVYLLVSSGPGRGNRKSKLKLDILKKQNVSILSEIFLKEEAEFRINIKETRQSKLNGLVADIKKDKENRYEVSVYYRKPAIRLSSGFEKVELELSGSGECRAELIALDKNNKPVNPDAKQVLFLSRKNAAQEKVQVLFYRVGTARVEAKCGDDSIFTQDFRPDELT